VRDVWSALALLVVGLVALLEVRRLPVGSVATPGPGFVPLALAVALIVVATVLAVRALARRGDAVAPSTSQPARRWWRPVMVVLAVFAYTLLLTRLGFVLSTSLLMVVLFRLVESPRWPLALGGSVAVAVLAHVVFKTWLGVRLPPGPWGF